MRSRDHLTPIGQARQAERTTARTINIRPRRGSAVGIRETTIVSDLGFTHVAIEVSNLDDSIAFYAKYARMELVDQRHDPSSGTQVAWISDRTRPFIIVLIEASSRSVWRARIKDLMRRRIAPFSHFGVGCESRAAVDELVDQARRDGILLRPPVDGGPPVGYFAIIRDPDGNSLEVAFGQDVGLTIEKTAHDQNSERTG